MNATKNVLISALFCVITFTTNAQDIATMYNYFDSSEQIREFLFSNKGGFLQKGDDSKQFTTHYPEFADEIFQHLSCVGDFDGDGADEIAIFHRVRYTPNCFVGHTCPPYYQFTITLLKSKDESFYSYGSWFSVIDSEVEPMMIRFAKSGDYNGDGFDDIAIVYKDTFAVTPTEHLAVFLSDGKSFSSPQVFYNTIASPYQVDSMHFALSGDFNSDGKADLALFYQDASSVPAVKNIVVFESNTTSFSPVSYAHLPDSFSLEKIHHAFAGKFNNDLKDDIAIIYDSDYTSANDSGIVVFVFENENLNFSSAKNYANLNVYFTQLSQIIHATSGDINGDGKSDIIYFFDSFSAMPLEHKIMALHATGNSFTYPQLYYETAVNDFNFHRTQHLLFGNFTLENEVSATLWKNNAKGALTFSFDDGFTETIEHAKYLYTKNLRSTHNVISNEAGKWLYAPWQNMRNDSLGNEYASHSNTHPALNQIPLASAANELSISKQIIDDSLQQKTTSFIFPFGGFSREVLHLPEMSNNYLSARTSMRGYNLATPIDFYALKAEVILQNTSLQQCYEWIDWSETHKYWLFLMYHYIGYTGSDPDLLDYNATVSDFRATVDYAASKDVWVDTQEKIYKYIKERNALQTKTYTLIDSNKVLVNIEDGLDDNVYNEALTIKLKLPAFWQFDSVMVEQNAKAEKQAVVVESGKRYVYFNALPNNSDVFIYPQLQNAIMEEKKQADFKIKVWPNPAKHIVYVAIPEMQTSEYRVIVYNAMGQQVQSIHPSNSTAVLIERNNLQPGLYFVVVKNKGEVIGNEKFVFE